MTMNALDTALVKLAAASTALEHTARPGLKDVEEAKKQAKAAAEILDSAHKLLSYGVYTVADAPAEPGPALFKSNGEPAVQAPTAEEPEAAPTPTPIEFLRSWEGWTEDERKEHFGIQVEALRAFYAHVTESPEPLEVLPLVEIFSHDPLTAFQAVLFCLDQEAFSLPPDLQAVATWVENLGKLPPLPEELLLWDGWSEEEQQGEFERRLDDLRNCFPQDPDLDWEPWDQTWNTDPKDAFTRLLVAENRAPETKSWDVPTDEERNAWLAAHAQPEAEPKDPEAEALAQSTLFEEKLQELEKAGVEEAGLKRKAWKKAEAAWREAFEADPAGTIDRLLWRLQQAHIAWEVPTPEEVAA